MVVHNQTFLLMHETREKEKRFLSREVSDASRKIFESLTHRLSVITANSSSDPFLRASASRRKVGTLRMLRQPREPAPRHRAASGPLLSRPRYRSRKSYLCNDKKQQASSRHRTPLCNFPLLFAVELVDAKRCHRTR